MPFKDANAMLEPRLRIEMHVIGLITIITFIIQLNFEKLYDIKYTILHDTEVNID